MKSFLIALLFGFGTLNAAEDLHIEGPYEHFALNADKIYAVSAFDELTYITAYSLDGTPLWEAPFTSKILSWKIKDGQLIVFSIERTKIAYFLTCVDATHGTLVWERVIYTPSAS